MFNPQVALNYSVFLREIMGDHEKAIEMAKQAFDGRFVQSSCRPLDNRQILHLVFLSLWSVLSTHFVSFHQNGLLSCLCDHFLSRK